MSLHALADEVKISIIMCAKDAENSIYDAILSLAPMSKDSEICFVDDGSSDKTSDIAIEAAAEIGMPIRSEILRSNVGVPKARNIAASMASGSWLMIHDADDVSLPSRMEDTIVMLESSDVVGGWAMQKLPDGRIDRVMDYPPEKDREVRAMLFSSWLNPMIDPTTCFSRKMFLALGGYSEEERWRHVQDLEFWHRAARAGARFANVQKPLIVYSISPLGVTQTKKQEMIARHGELLRMHSMQIRPRSLPSWR